MQASWISPQRELRNAQPFCRLRKAPLFVLISRGGFCHPVATAGPALLWCGENVERDFAMEITRAGSKPSAKGPGDWFTGTVRIDPLFQAPSPARAAGAAVTFEPSARTAWHTHPLGQTLIVTAGSGRVQ